MNHEQFKRLASRQADNELDENGNMLLNAHLSECAECRAFAADLNILKTGVKAIEDIQLSGAVNRAMLERAYQETAPQTTFLQRFLTRFPWLKPSFTYVVAALVIGILVGGVGFKMSNWTNRQLTTSYIPEETARLFDAVTPGSLSEILIQVKKEKL